MYTYTICSLYLFYHSNHDIFIRINCNIYIYPNTYFKQYMKNKPTKWGLKLWCLADSKSGYTQYFSVYTGKQQGASDHGQGYDVLITLLRSAELLGHGYHLYVDNFFTSVALFDYLYAQHTLCCGTVRLGRRNFPKEVVGKKPAGLGRERGSFVKRQKGNKLVMAWRDRKIVYMLTTIHHPTTESSATC